MYVLVLLTDRGEAPATHEAFVDDLVARGVLLLGGPFESPDAGGPHAAYVLRCEDEAQARALVGADPAVASGPSSADVLPWDLVGINLAAVDPSLAAGSLPPDVSGR